MFVRRGRGGTRLESSNAPAGVRRGGQSTRDVSDGKIAVVVENYSPTIMQSKLPVAPKFTSLENGGMPEETG